MSNEVFNMIGMSARKDKNVVNGLLWIYFMVRLYQKYGKINSALKFYIAYFDNDAITAAIFHMVCSDQIAKTL